MSMNENDRVEWLGCGNEGMRGTVLIGTDSDEPTARVLVSWDNGTEGNVKVGALRKVGSLDLDDVETNEGTLQKKDRVEYGHTGKLGTVAGDPYESLSGVAVAVRWDDGAEGPVNVEDLNKTMSPRDTDPGCECYPGGFTPDSFEGPQEDCPVHGRDAVTVIMTTARTARQAAAAAAGLSELSLMAAWTYDSDEGRWVVTVAYDAPLTDDQVARRTSVLRDIVRLF